MDFLEFLKNNPGTYSYNKVEFNGHAFRQCNDTFPKFEVVDGTIRESLGDWTPYTLSSVNTWGAGDEYSILKNGSFTGFNIKFSDGCVELYSAGVRYYGDLDQGRSAEITPSKPYEPSRPYSSSSSEADPAVFLGILGILFPPLEVCLMLAGIKNTDFKEKVGLTSAVMSGFGVLWSVPFFFAWYFGAGGGSFDHNYFCAISLLYMISYAVYWVFFFIVGVEGENYDRIPLVWRVLISIIFWVLFVAGYAIVIMYVGGIFG